LISVRTPTSSSTGKRRAAGTAISANRSKFEAKSSRAKSGGTPASPKVGVSASQPPTASAPISGFT
jgi:hypothetical protein